MLFAGAASGQTYNVSVTNSLLGPVTLVVSGTVNNVTNEFAPVNNITNTFESIVSVTNIIGATTVVNSNTFFTSITNDVDVAGVTVTNNIVIDQATYITNLIDQFIGVNVFAPIEVETNATDTWTISLTTNYAVGTYLQTGNITSVVFNVDSTNDVALGQVLLLATTNAITWPTNGLTWAAGSAPTTVSNQYNRLYFEAWRDAVFGVYVGANP